MDFVDFGCSGSRFNCFFITELKAVVNPQRNAQKNIKGGGWGVKSPELSLNDIDLLCAGYARLRLVRACDVSSQPHHQLRTSLLVEPRW